MLKSRLKPFASTLFHNGIPGYLSAPGQFNSGYASDTLATIDNRELKNTDGFIELSGFGRISPIDPLSSLPDDLVMVFGDDGDHLQEVVLFDKVFSTDVDFKLHYQFHVAPNGYEGAFTVTFSTGEVIMNYVYIPDVGENNFTSIRFKNTKLSNSNVIISLQAFNVVLHK